MGLGFRLPEAYHYPEGQKVVEPHENDVLCGRGGGSNSHPGNMWFRRLVYCNRPLYRASPKHTKLVVAKAIVQCVHEQIPPGRFLEHNKETGMYHVVPYKRAVEKSSQSLREKNDEEKMREAQEEKADAKSKKAPFDPKQKKNHTVPVPLNPMGTPVDGSEIKLLHHSLCTKSKELIKKKTLEAASQANTTAATTKKRELPTAAAAAKRGLPPLKANTVAAARGGMPKMAVGPGGMPNTAAAAPGGMPHMAPPFGMMPPGAMNGNYPPMRNPFLFMSMNAGRNAFPPAAAMKGASAGNTGPTNIITTPSIQKGAAAGNPKLAPTSAPLAGPSETNNMTHSTEHPNGQLPGLPATNASSDTDDAQKKVAETSTTAAPAASDLKCQEAGETQAPDTSTLPPGLSKLPTNTTIHPEQHLKNQFMANQMTMATAGFGMPMNPELFKGQMAAGISPYFPMMPMANGMNPQGLAATMAAGAGGMNSNSSVAATTPAPTGVNAQGSGATETEAPSATNGQNVAATTAEASKGPNAQNVAQGPPTTLPAIGKLVTTTTVATTDQPLAATTTAAPAGKNLAATTTAAQAGVDVQNLEMKTEAPAVPTTNFPKPSDTEATDTSSIAAAAPTAGSTQGGAAAETKLPTMEELKKQMEMLNQGVPLNQEQLDSQMAALSQQEQVTNQTAMLSQQDQLKSQMAVLNQQQLLQRQMAAVNQITALNQQEQLKRQMASFKQQQEEQLKNSMTQEQLKSQGQPNTPTGNMNQDHIKFQEASSLSQEQLKNQMASLNQQQLKSQMANFGSFPFMNPHLPFAMPPANGNAPKSGVPPAALASATSTASTAKSADSADSGTTAQPTIPAMSSNEEQLKMQMANFGSPLMNPSLPFPMAAAEGTGMPAMGSMNSGELSESASMELELQRQIVLLEQIKRNIAYTGPPALNPMLSGPLPTTKDSSSKEGTAEVATPETPTPTVQKPLVGASGFGTPTAALKDVTAQAPSLTQLQTQASAPPQVQTQVSAMTQMQPQARTPAQATAQVPATAQMQPQIPFPAQMPPGMPAMFNCMHPMHRMPNGFVPPFINPRAPSSRIFFDAKASKPPVKVFIPPRPPKPPPKPPKTPKPPAPTEADLAMWAPQMSSDLKAQMSGYALQALQSAGAISTDGVSNPSVTNFILAGKPPAKPPAKRSFKDTFGTGRSRNHRMLPTKRRRIEDDDDDEETDMAVPPPTEPLQDRASSMFRYFHENKILSEDPTKTKQKDLPTTSHDEESPLTMLMKVATSELVQNENEENMKRVQSSSSLCPADLTRTTTACSDLTANSTLPFPQDEEVRHPGESIAKASATLNRSMTNQMSDWFKSSFLHSPEQEQMLPNLQHAASSNSMLLPPVLSPAPSSNNFLHKLAPGRLLSGFSSMFHPSQRVGGGTTTKSTGSLLDDYEETDLEAKMRTVPTNTTD